MLRVCLLSRCADSPWETLHCCSALLARGKHWNSKVLLPFPLDRAGAFSHPYDMSLCWTQTLAWSRAVSAGLWGDISEITESRATSGQVCERQCLAQLSSSRVSGYKLDSVRFIQLCLCSSAEGCLVLYFFASLQVGRQVWRYLQRILEWT